MKNSFVAAVEQAIKECKIKIIKGATDEQIQKITKARELFGASIINLAKAYSEAKEIVIKDGASVHAITPTQALEDDIGRFVEAVNMQLEAQSTDEPLSDADVIEQTFDRR